MFKRKNKSDIRMSHAELDKVRIKRRLSEEIRMLEAKNKEFRAAERLQTVNKSTPKLLEDANTELTVSRKNEVDVVDSVVCDEYAEAKLDDAVIDEQQKTISKAEELDANNVVANCTDDIVSNEIDNKNDDNSNLNEYVFVEENVEKEHSTSIHEEVLEPVEESKTAASEESSSSSLLCTAVNAESAIIPSESIPQPELQPESLHASNKELMETSTILTLSPDDGDDKVNCNEEITSNTHHTEDSIGENGQSDHFTTTTTLNEVTEVETTHDHVNDVDNEQNENAAADIDHTQLDENSPELFTSDVMRENVQQSSSLETSTERSEVTRPHEKEIKEQLQEELQQLEEQEEKEYIEGEQEEYRLEAEEEMKESL